MNRLCVWMMMSCLLFAESLYPLALNSDLPPAASMMTVVNLDNLTEDASTDSHGLHFVHPDIADCTGSKVTKLVELIANGVNAPELFATTTHAYQKLLVHNNPQVNLADLNTLNQMHGAFDLQAISQLIESENESTLSLLEFMRSVLKNFDASDEAQLESVSIAIQHYLKTVPFPEDLASEVYVAYEQLLNDRDPNVMPMAVRSSATSEDVGAEHLSFKVNLKAGSSAGQQRTHLNVRGKENIVARIQDVMASLFQPEALSYRNTQAYLAFLSRLNYKDVQKFVGLLEKYSFEDELKDSVEELKLLGDSHHHHLSVPSAKIRRILASLQEGSEGEDESFAQRLILHLEEALEPFTNPQKLSIAVVVQRMVKSDQSYVAFSYDQKSGFTGMSFEDKNLQQPYHGRVFMLQVADGLGEGVVQGVTIPDKYLVHVLEDAQGQQQVNILHKELGSKKSRFVYIQDLLTTLGMTEEQLKILVDDFKQGAGMSNDSYRQISSLFSHQKQVTEAGFLSQSIPLEDLNKELDQLIARAKSTGDIHDKMSLTYSLPENAQAARENLINLAMILRARLEDPLAETVHTFNPRENQQKFALNDEKVSDVIRNNLNATNVYQYRAEDVSDMEGAVQDGTVHLTQIRPKLDDNTDVKEPKVLRIEKTVLDEKRIKEQRIDLKQSLLVKGEPGKNAASGVIKYFAKGMKRDGKEVTLPQWISEVQELVRAGTSVVIVTPFTTPEFEPAMKVASAIISYQGGSTSHASIVANELGLPNVVGIEAGLDIISSEQRESVEQLLRADLKLITVDGNSGAVYEGELPIKTESLKIDIDRLPRLQFSKTGLIMANPQKMREVSKIASYDSHYGISLLRAEMLLVESNIHPRAVLAYDAWRARLKPSVFPEGGFAQDSLSEDILLLQKHPDVIQKIEEKIRGYQSAREYHIQTLQHGIAAMAAANHRENKVLYRFNDFKQGELRQLIGGELFGLEERSTMLGHRGAGWLTEEDNAEAFAMEIEALKRVKDQGYTSVGAFYPFVRTVDELKAGLNRLIKKKLWLNDIGIMAELPSNVVQADEMLEALAEYALKVEKETAQKPNVFISFGTNDLTQTERKAGRDEPAVKGLYDETHSLVIGAIRHVAYAVQRAQQKFQEQGVKISCGLCGQALAKLLDPNQPNYNPKVAREIISMLDSGGTQISGYKDLVRAAVRAEMEFSERDNQEMQDDLPLIARGRSNLERGVASNRRLLVAQNADFFVQNEKREVKGQSFMEPRDSVYPGEIVYFPGDIQGVQKDKLEQALKEALVLVFDSEDVVVNQMIPEDLARTYNVPYFILEQNLEHNAIQEQFVSIDFVQGTMVQGALPIRRQILSEDQKQEEDIFNIPKEDPQWQRTDFAMGEKSLRLIKSNVFWKELNVHPMAYKDYLDKSQNAPQGISNALRIFRSKFVDSDDENRSSDERGAKRVARGKQGAQTVGTTGEDTGDSSSQGNGDNEVYDLESLFFSFMKYNILGINQALVWEMSDFGTEELRKLIGGKEKSLEEENPPLGLGGLHLWLQEAYQGVLEAQLKALARIQREGTPVAVLLSDVRDISDFKVFIQRATAAGLDMQSLKFGLRIDNNENYVFLKEYFNQGIEFITYDEQILAQSYLAADMSNEHVPTVQKYLKRSLGQDPLLKVKWMIAQAAKDYNDDMQHDKDITWFELPEAFYYSQQVLDEKVKAMGKVQASS